MEDYKFIDNDKRKQYEFHIDGVIAKITYLKSKSGDIYLTHTHVPRSHEGKGIAAQLTRLVLEDIENKGLRLVPLCGFVSTFIKRHPEWEHLVMESVEVE